MPVESKQKGMRYGSSTASVTWECRGQKVDFPKNGISFDICDDGSVIDEDLTNSKRKHPGENVVTNSKKMKSNDVIITDKRRISITRKQLKILDSGGKEGWLDEKIVNYFFGQVILISFINCF